MFKSLLITFAIFGYFSCISSWRLNPDARVNFLKSDVVAEICLTCSETVLFNFNEDADVSSWEEQSDAQVWTTGRSKAAIRITENGDYRNAVLLALLNPTMSGAGFAQMRMFQTFDLSAYNNLVIQCRGQGQYSGWKVVLRHQGLNSDLNSTYEHFFTAPDTFTPVTLPLVDFKPYFRGSEVVDGEALDKSDITVFGLQFYGGVNQNVSQSGPATLEIDWIKATS